MSLHHKIILHADQFSFRISTISQVQRTQKNTYASIIVSLQFDADIGKLRQRTQKKNVIKKFSIPSTLQFSRILWNLLLCMLSHCVTDFLPHSHYFYGDIRFFLLPACISFFIQLSTSINFMTHNCFYDYVDDDDTDAIDAFGICNFFNSTLSFFLFVSLCV